MVETPEQKWQKQIQQLRKVCQQIMGVSKQIRYAGSINEYGRTLVGIIRPGVKPLLKSDQVKNEFFIISTLMTLRQHPAKAVGKLDYVHLKHQKISIIAIQKNKITFYISIDSKEKNIERIISEIKKKI